MVDREGQPATAASGAAVAARRGSAGEVHLRLLETTDLHTHILPYDYFADCPAEGEGLAHTATLIRAARAEAENVLLFDNGDSLQGTPMADWAAAQGGDRLHPVIRAMNLLGVDAAVPGNHDFNYGLDFLTRALAGAGFPVVCANVVTGALAASPCDDATLLPASVILERTVRDGAGAAHPLRIGILGLVPPQVAAWDARYLAGRAVLRDMVETAAARVPALRAAGADIVVALAHTGIGGADAVPGMENAARPLARIAGLDVLMLGHSHRVFPGEDFEGLDGVDCAAGTIAGTPAVMAGSRGSYLGVVDLRLRRDARGWRVTGHAVETRPVAARAAGGCAGAPVPADPDLTQAMAADHAATLAHIRRPVGQCAVPLATHFALVAPSAALALVAEVQRAHVAQALAGTPHAGLPVVSAASPFKAGGRAGPGNYTDIAAGPVTAGNLADLYPFPNAVQALRLTGAGLRAWLERAAALYLQVAPGAEDARLIDPEFPAYEYDVVHGLGYRIDLARPLLYDRLGRATGQGRGRIGGLTVNGRPLASGDEVILATNSYRAGGGGRYPGAGAEAGLLATGPEVRSLLAAALGRGAAPPPDAAPWGFAPMPGTSVVFESGRGSAAHLGRIAGREIEPAGSAPGGFLRYRLRL